MSTILSNPYSVLHPGLTLFCRLASAALCLSTLYLLFSTLLPVLSCVFFVIHRVFNRLEVTIWFVPSLIENALAISFIGFLLGPMYPILMSYCTQVLPKWLLTGCVGCIGGFGQAGSAVLPFATGLLASKFGIGSLQPL